MLRQLLKKIIYRIRGEYTVEDLIKLGLKVGKGFNPQLGFELDPSHCWLIDIGDNVTFAPHVQVLAHDASTCVSLGYAKIGRVHIGNNVFIGAGSIILPDVSLGDNTIVGAGSVVTHSFDGDVVIAGNPARVIESLNDFTAKQKKLMDERPCYGEEYTLRCNITPERKQQQIDDLRDGIGFVR